MQRTAKVTHADELGLCLSSVVIFFLQFGHCMLTGTVPKTTVLLS